MGEGFPEYDKWRADGQREREEHRRKVEELSGDPERLLLWSFQQMQEDMPSDEPHTRDEGVGKMGKGPLESVDNSQ